MKEKSAFNKFLLRLLHSETVTNGLIGLSVMVVLGIYALVIGGIVSLPFLDIDREIIQYIPSIALISAAVAYVLFYHLVSSIVDKIIINNLRKTKRHCKLVPFSRPSFFSRYSSKGYKTLGTGKIVISSNLEIAEDFCDGVALFKVNRFKINRYYPKYGYIGENNDFYIPPIFNYAESFNRGFALVQKNSVTYILTKNLSFYYPYQNIGHFSEGLALVMFKNKYGYINKSGEILIPTKYDDARMFEGEGAFVKENGKWGIIDKLNNFIVAPIHDDLPYEEGERAGLKYRKSNEALEGSYNFYTDLTPEQKDGKWGFVRADGTFVIKPVFDDAVHFTTPSNASGEPLARIMIGGKFGAIDTRGEIIIEPIYDEWFFFEDNLTVVKKGDSGFVIDREGKERLEVSLTPGSIFSPEGYINDFHEGIAVFKQAHTLSNLVDDNTDCGFIDSEGKITVLDSHELPVGYEKYEKYDSSYGSINKIRNFHYGLAAVYVSIRYSNQRKPNQTIKDWLQSHECDGGWGFIDKTGTFIIPPIYEDVRDFSEEGCTSVKKEDGEWMVINRNNEIVPELPSSESFKILKLDWNAFVIIANNGEVLNPSALSTIEDMAKVSAPLYLG